MCMALCMLFCFVKEEGADWLREREASEEAGNFLSGAVIGTSYHLELELGLIQSQMTQKPVLRDGVGARALRNPEGEGGVGGWYIQASTPRRGGACARV